MLSHLLQTLISNPGAYPPYHGFFSLECHGEHVKHELNIINHSNDIVVRALELSLLHFGAILIRTWTSETRHMEHSGRNLSHLASVTSISDVL